jgi:L-asparaginase/Glu-tRNA(Gln) amidotransferase subunit D
LTLNEARLKNPSSFERYAHLGTYDLFITYVHELFHKEEQSKRNTPTNLADKERNELLDAYEARAARAVIIQQLLSAFSSPQTELAYLKKAVATYRAYEKAFPQDATITHQWDTLEGSAYYFELISSLKV